MSAIMVFLFYPTVIVVSDFFKVGKIFSSISYPVFLHHLFQVFLVEAESAVVGPLGISAGIVVVWPPL